jgi:hypothetical protein
MVIPSDGDFTKTSITGTLSKIAQNEAYLRVDGENYMKQSIVLYDPTNDVPFAPPAVPSANNLMGVKHINFDTASGVAPTGITGVDAILFDSVNPTTKLIEGLDTMTFANAAPGKNTAITNLGVLSFIGAGGTITNLQLLNFISSTTGIAAITNLNQLQFGGTSPTINFPSNNGVINGVATLGATNLNVAGTLTFGDGTTMTTINYPTTAWGSKNGNRTKMTSLSNSICFLNLVQIGVVGSKCNIEQDSDGSWYINSTSSSGAANCNAMCLVWGPQS